jgi:hypothetical protein
MGMLEAVPSRRCICCGEPKPGKGSAGNPNLCPTCSGLADDLEAQDAETPECSYRVAQLQTEAEEELRRAA